MASVSGAQSRGEEESTSYYNNDTIYVYHPSLFTLTYRMTDRTLHFTSQYHVILEKCKQYDHHTHFKICIMTLIKKTARLEAEIYQPITANHRYINTTAYSSW